MAEFWHPSGLSSRERRTGGVHQRPGAGFGHPQACGAARRHVRRPHDRSRLNAVVWSGRAARSHPLTCPSTVGSALDRLPKCESKQGQVKVFETLHEASEGHGFEGAIDSSPIRTRL